MGFFKRVFLGFVGRVFGGHSCVNSSQLVLFTSTLGCTMFGIRVPLGFIDFGNTGVKKDGIHLCPSRESGFLLDLGLGGL